MRQLIRYLSLTVLCCLLLVGVAVQNCSRIKAQSGEYEIVKTVTVGPGVWVSTDITLIKGQRFKVVATGILKYTEYPFTEIGPSGNGYYSLKGLIKDPFGANDQFMVLGANGGDTARFSGELLLAATRSIYYRNGDPTHAEDAYLKGGFAVTVYLEKIAPLPKVVTKGPVTLLKLTGDANVLPRGADWQEAFEGMKLGAEDEIHTGPDSGVILLFPDGSTIEVNELTRIRMGGFLNEDTRFKNEILLRMGKIYAKTKPQQVIRSGFSVRTPTATASVRGTAFTVRFNETTQTTTVSVQEHSVLVTPTDTSLKPFVLNANQEVEVSQNSAGIIHSPRNDANKLVWIRVGTGDCGGMDVGSSEGATPDENQAKEGLTAVCWDGVENRSNGGRIWCTYKRVALEKCTGGGNPGAMYRAVPATGGETVNPRIGSKIGGKIDDITTGGNGAAIAPIITVGVLNSYAVERVEPIYPAAARAANVSGTVVVQVTIDERGNVTTAQAISGHPLLRNAAVAAAQQWKFRLTRPDGVSVKAKGTININFAAP